MPDRSCHRKPMLLAIMALLALTLPCNSWLFLQRIRALPPHFCHKVYRMVCHVLWVSTLSSFIIFWGITTSQSGNGDGTCELTISYNNQVICAPIFLMILFDTVTFFVISMSFIVHNPAPSWVGRVKAVVLLKYMGPTSGAYVRSGQMYYLYVFNLIS